MQTASPPTLTRSPDLDYEQFLREGRFMIQRSRSSGNHVFYPRIAEPVSGAMDLEWVPASGGGTVYSATVIRPRAPNPPYNVCLIDLDEGPRMMSRVDGIAADAVKLGMRVRAQIITEADKPLVVFTPQGDAA
jgi:uncharacterized OB-fold protein